jgi:DNA-binding GntR family transcriptional regulator
MPTAVQRTGQDPADGLKQLLEAGQARYITVGDLAYSVLREAILRGVLEPGAHLRQDALASAMGMSRIPVRSALFQLESDGLVEIRPHRGARVKIHTPAQVREIYETRMVLESHAVRKAIAAMTPDWLKRLEKLARAMDRVDRSQPGEAFIKAETAFYRELYEPVNKVIADLSERLRGDLGRYWVRPLVGYGEEQTHAALIQYLREGDADGAAAWISHHLAKVADQVTAMLEARES